MKKSTLSALLLSASFVVLVVFGLLQNQYYTPLEPAEVKTLVEEKVEVKRIRVLEIAEEVESAIRLNHSDSLWASPYFLKTIKEKDIVHLFVFRGDELVFWNNNRISTHRLNRILPDTRMMHLRNSFCLTHSRLVNDFKIVALTPIKYEFPLNNTIVSDRFEGISLYSSVAISLQERDEGINIYSSKKDFLFNLDGAKLLKKASHIRDLGLVSFHIGLLLFILGFLVLFSHLRSRIYLSIGLGVFVSVILGFIASLLWFNMPALLFEMPMFSPTIMAFPRVFTSLGLTFYLSCFWLVVCFVVFRHGILSRKYRSKSLNLISTLLLLFLFGEITHFFFAVIDNSTISFDLHKLRAVSTYSYLAYFIFFMFYGGWVLLVVRNLKLYLNVNLRELIAYFLSFVVVVLVFQGVRNGLDEVVGSSIGAVVYALIYYLQKRETSRLSFVHYMLFSLLFTFVFAYGAWVHSHENRLRKQETTIVNMAVGFLSERDNYAEMLLMRMDKRFQEDEHLSKIMSSEDPNPEKVIDYLRREYFSGIWKKYELQIVMCWPNADLFIEESENYQDCYTYFSDKLLEQGEQIDTTRFYFLDNQNGRKSYFGKLVFRPEESNEITLYMQLESLPFSEGKGYPELILDKNVAFQTRSRIDKNYARYSEGQLINYHGNYKYLNDTTWIPPFKGDFEYVTKEGYTHLVYKADEREYIVLTNKSRSLYQLLLLVTYIYLYVFAVLFIVIALLRFFYVEKAKKESFEGRVRFAMLSILLLSFALVGITSTYFNSNVVSKKQYTSIEEQTATVLSFMKDIFGEYEVLSSAEGDLVSDILQSISNNLHLDINMFDLDGSLINTSRPQIYSKSLFSRQMSPRAYVDLVQQKKPLIVQSEYLGELEYLSSYFVLYNFNDKPIGFINVPFFVSGDELSRDTSDYIVVLVNVYLIFILLALSFTFIFTRSLTRPLLIIRDKLAAIRLGSLNEEIAYHRNDEIGELVAQYNRMVGELEDSAERLAASQRKLAWREMARQIAHEIKNPLTPMKLNLQHLQRAKKDNSPHFDKMLNKTVQSLVEQIDNLSRIAGEFSTFAKIPDPKPGKINLTQQLYSAFTLFSESSEAELQFNFPIERKVFVYADPKQITQVMNNLIKNAIQSIPEGGEGKVEIGLSKDKEQVLVSVRDNGKGVPDDIKEKLFEPNFTTKSSGMGLGLAIVKNIISNAGGTIWFESEYNKGTTFYLSLPVVEE